MTSNTGRPVYWLLAYWWNSILVTGILVTSILVTRIVFYQYTSNQYTGIGACLVRRAKVLKQFNSFEMSYWNRSVHWGDGFCQISSSGGKCSETSVGIRCALWAAISLNSSGFMNLSWSSLGNNIANCFTMAPNPTLYSCTSENSVHEENDWVI